MTDILNPGEYYSVNAELIRVRIRLTPGSRKEGFGGLYTDNDGQQWLKASVRAVPEDGKANDALTRLLARTLGVAKGSIVHVSGHTSRMKIFELPKTPLIEAALANKDPN